VLPAGTWNDTSSTTVTRPLSVAKETERLSTERRGVAFICETGGHVGPPLHRSFSSGRPHAVAPVVHSRTTRGKYIDTTQFGWSTISLMRRSAQTLQSM